MTWPTARFGARACTEAAGRVPACRHRRRGPARSASSAPGRRSSTRAREIADEESLATVSLRQVTKQVGIVPTAFYRHFASIDELGLALVDQSFASLREMLRDVRPRPPS